MSIFRGKSLSLQVSRWGQFSYRLATWSAWLTAPVIANALILYNGDNEANQMPPDPARAHVFEAVARVCNGDGSGTAGSAVHLRGKYLLTADHVGNRSHVTFDGLRFFARDTAFAPIKIGGADLKLIKLIEDPGLPEKALFTGVTGDVFSTGTLVGWGRGRDPSVDDAEGGPTNTWAWGTGATEAKRWGTNRIDSQIVLQGPFGNTYEALVTNLNRDADDNEAGAALFDSGSGLFVEDDGVWKLAGVTTAVSVLGSSTFGSFLDWDQNYFVRIRSYADAVETQLPNLKNYTGWKVDHSLYGGEAADEADTDGDGFGQLLEFALGGDPRVTDLDILPSGRLIEEAGSRYLELMLTRPEGLQGITYTPQTTEDLDNWPSDSTGILDPSPLAQSNGNGTETLIYRRSQAVDEASPAFIRIKVSEIP